MYSLCSLFAENCFTCLFVFQRQFDISAPGETVTIAEEMAARDALRRIWHFEQSSGPLPFDSKLHSFSGSSSVNKNKATNVRT